MDNRYRREGTILHKFAVPVFDTQAMNKWSRGGAFPEFHATTAKDRE